MSGNVQRDIAEVFVALDDAWNRGDAAGVAAVFASDCVLVSPYGAIAKGREGVERQLTPAFAANLKGSSRKTSIESARSVADGLTLFAGSIRFSGARTPWDEARPSDDRAVLTGIGCRTNGGWEIASAQVTHVAAQK